MRTISRLPFLLFSGVAIAFAGLAPRAVTSQHDVDLAHGAGMYRAHCGRCHGTHGDDISCSGDMTPLAGLGKRPRIGLVAELMSSKYFLRGKQFEGDDARDLTAYVCSLKGEKGFDAPEFVCLPRLLSKEYGFLRHYRIIDVRDDAAYAKAHIPNAVVWPSPLGRESPFGSTDAEMRSTLGLLGVHPETMIVIYDEGVSTRAALLWWRLIRAGHTSVAILDGGFSRWAEEGYLVTSVLTPMTPSEYGAALPAATRFPAADMNYPLLRFDTGSLNGSPGTFNPAFTLKQGSLRTAAEIRSYLNRCGIRSAATYRLEGRTSDAPFLVYLLHLLGFRGVEFDPGNNLIQIAAHP